MSTARDTEILKVELAEVLDGLRKMVAYAEANGLDWRSTFERAERDWRAKGNGQPTGSDYARECYGYATAHRLILDGAA